MPLLAPKTAQELILRINQLQPESLRKWGNMSIEEMLVHCAAGIQMGLGELPAKVRVSPLRGAIARLLYIELLPFPKLAAAPAELNINKKLKTRLDFDSGKQQLIQLVKKMETTPDSHKFPVHPIFHKLSRRQWSKLFYKHLDHHLKQFGV